MDLATLNPRFEMALKVAESDIDALGHVNNIVYLEWVQEVSGAHWQSATSSEQQQQYRWIVLRHEIDYYKAAFAGDELILHTRVLSFEGPKSIRQVEIKRNDQLLAKAVTQWCLINAKNGRPMRIPQEIADIFIKK